MTTTQSSVPDGSARVRDVARKLELHIRSREFRPGDRYITADEGARLLGESEMTVQRAMALLARRKVLERRPKAGTFVGNVMTERAGLPTLYFLMPDAYIVEGQEPYWTQVRGIRSVLPDLAVQMNFIANQSVARAEDVVRQATAAGSLAAVVLVLPSREMRVYFNQSGIPTVVTGGVEPDLRNLGWLNIDQAQTGRLLAQYLFARGHRRLATINRDLWAVGEHLLHDGIGEAVAAAGLAATAVRIRNVPVDHSAVTEVIRDLLRDPADRPTGFICRTVFQADCVMEVADAFGLRDSVEAVVCNLPDRPHASKYTFPEPEAAPFEEGRQIGLMLQAMIQKKLPQPQGYTIPVTLRTVEGTPDRAVVPK